MRKRTILIFSDIRDFSTSEVMLWLRKNAFNEIKRLPEVVRINQVDILEQALFTIKLEVDLNVDYDGKDIISFWMRKDFQLNQSFDESTPEYLKFANRELTEYKKNVYSSLYSLSTINSYLGGEFVNHMMTNKFRILMEAAKLGITIPKTIITNNRKALLEFIRLNGKCISKPLFEVASIESDDKSRTIMYTRIIDTLDFETLPDIIFPSMVQKYIEKEYEIRVFVFNQEFYAAAIFSQGHEETSIDFRNMSKYNIPRIVPYVLPEKLEFSLSKLFDRLKINTGSLDLIRSGTDYYFLEINTCGQYGFISDCCNYHLDERIANYLCYENEIM